MIEQGPRLHDWVKYPCQKKKSVFCVLSIKFKTQETIAGHGGAHF